MRVQKHHFSLLKRGSVGYTSVMFYQIYSKLIFFDRFVNKEHGIMLNFFSSFMSVNHKTIEINIT